MFGVQLAVRDYHNLHFRGFAWFFSWLKHILRLSRLVSLGTIILSSMSTTHQVTERRRLNSSHVIWLASWTTFWCQTLSAPCCPYVVLKRGIKTCWYNRFHTLSQVHLVRGFYDFILHIYINEYLLNSGCIMLANNLTHWQLQQVQNKN